MRTFLSLFLLGTCLLSTGSAAPESKRPNILWIVAEDMNDFMSCYGHTATQTPTFDSMATHGVRFTRFYVTAPVCSASRSGLVLGAMQTTFNAQHHRSSISAIKNPSFAHFGKIELPKDVVPVHLLFQNAGYATCIKGKTDFNFEYDLAALSTVKDWTKVIEGDKPWFIQMQTKGGKGARKSLTKEESKNAVDESVLQLPKYFPDHPDFVSVIHSHYLDVLGEDKTVGEILSKLEEVGQLENTFVFFLSDHGMPSSPRHKQFCYEGGIRVPLIVRVPKNSDRISRGTVRDDLVSGVDIAPTSLALANIAIPEWMEGDDIFSKEYTPREFVISARDRCDFTIDRIRAVVSKKFKYLRNGFPERPYLQPQYRDDHKSLVTWKKLYAEGNLTPEAAALAAPDRPKEEFYDLENDPDEINNLAEDPQFKEELKRHRDFLDNWIIETGDKGQQTESDEALLQVLVKWGEERCVNPEYDRVKEKYREILPGLLAGAKKGPKKISLFDGKSLKGWKKTKFPKGHVYNGGLWEVESEAIIASRPLGDKRGSWLSTTKTYRDFVLEFDVKPDWGCDTGILLRHDGKGAGIQISIDYRNGGNIGFIHGQGSGSYYTRPWSFVGKINEDGELQLQTEKHYDAIERDGLIHACTGEEFLKVWKIDDWNHIKVRCVGSRPNITIWINDLKTCEMHSNSFKAGHPLRPEIPPYNADAVHKILGDSGRLALQIHPGKNWALPDGKCKFRNITVLKQKSPPVDDKHSKSGE